MKFLTNFLQWGIRPTNTDNFVARSITARVWELCRGTILGDQEEVVLGIDSDGRLICPGKIVLGTVQTTNSGTFKDFPILAGTKRITVMFNKVSINGNSDLLVQLGVGTAQNINYDSISIITNNANGTAGGSLTSGMAVRSAGTSYTFSGLMTIMKFSNSPTDYTWIQSHELKALPNANAGGGGNVILTGFPTVLRVTSTNGTDAFDDGALNVVCE